MADQTLHSMTQNTNPATTDELYLLDDPAGTPANNRITASDLLKVINNLTAETAMVFTTDYAVIYDASASNVRKVLLQHLSGYWMAAESFNNSPADATTYYFGSMYASALPTSATARKLIIPRTGTVRRIDIVVNNVGTAGSAETSTMSFRLNDTTDTAINASIVTNANGVFSNTALSIAVTAGDFFNIKWVTPTWATNPTGVYLHASIWIN